MHGAGEFGGQDIVDHALARDPADAGEGGRDDGHVEMRFAGVARFARAGMPRMPRAVVFDVEKVGGERGVQFRSHDIFKSHRLIDDASPGMSSELVSCFVTAPFPYFTGHE